MEEGGEEQKHTITFKQTETENVQTIERFEPKQWEISWTDAERLTEWATKATKQRSNWCDIALLHFSRVLFVDGIKLYLL